MERMTLAQMVLVVALVRTAHQGTTGDMRTARPRARLVQNTTLSHPFPSSLFYLPPSPEAAVKGLPSIGSRWSRSTAGVTSKMMYLVEVLMRTGYRNTYEFPDEKSAKEFAEIMKRKHGVSRTEVMVLR